MNSCDPTRAAELVSSIHAPWRATVRECIHLWANLDAAERAASYLVVRGDGPGLRQTFNSEGIAELATQL
jgi:hypothetical protein